MFVIADHYGRASLLNFYLPEAHKLLPEDQLVYVLATEKPQNQYWFWPSYDARVGENAIYVVKTSGVANHPSSLPSNSGPCKVLASSRSATGENYAAWCSSLPVTARSPPSLNSLVNPRTCGLWAIGRRGSPGAAKERST